MSVSTYENSRVILCHFNQMDFDGRYLLPSPLTHKLNNNNYEVYDVIEIPVYCDFLLSPNIAVHMIDSSCLLTPNVDEYVLECFTLLEQEYEHVIILVESRELDFKVFNK
jgi:hypothetical protein